MQHALFATKETPGLKANYWPGPGAPVTVRQYIVFSHKCRRFEGDIDGGGAAAKAQDPGDPWIAQDPRLGCHLGRVRS